MLFSKTPGLLCVATFLGFFCTGVASFDASTYPNHQNLIASTYDLYWKISGDEIKVALQVTTTGWIGFGLAEISSGAMPGADIVTVSVVGTTVEAIDRHALQFAYPPEDDCQDWKVVSGSEASGVTTVELSRKLVTNDTQDRSILPGRTRIVFAYSADGSDTVSYHSNHRGLSIVDFYQGVNPLAFNSTGTLSFDIKMGDVSLDPATETLYLCQSVALPKYENDAHIIRIEPVIDTASLPFIHHMELHACVDTSPSSFYEGHKNASVCYTQTGNPSVACPTTVFVWALGMGAFNLPSPAGFRMGNNTLIRDMVLEVHYSNPTLIPNIRDSSGLRIYYTFDLRQYDAAVLSAGDPFVSAKPIPANTARWEVETECPSNCTKQWSHDIVVFGDFLHMHGHGTQMYSTHWRGDTFLGDLDRVDYYGFDYQQFVLVNTTIRAGDRINTHCIYSTLGLATPVPFGLPSSQEMCVEFIFYYPQLLTNDGSPYSLCGYTNYYGDLPYTVCGATDNVYFLPGNPLTVDPPGMGNKTFGNAPSHCPNLESTTTAAALHSSFASRISMTSAFMLLFVALLL